MASTCCVNSPMNVKANSLSPSSSNKPKHISPTHLSFASNTASFSLNSHEYLSFRTTYLPKATNFQVGTFEFPFLHYFWGCCVIYFENIPFFFFLMWLQSDSEVFDWFYSVFCNLIRRGGVLLLEFIYFCI